MTEDEIVEYIKAKLKPLLLEWAQAGRPIETFGGLLIGYGVTAMQRSGVPADEIRLTVDLSLNEAATPTTIPS